MRQAYFFLLQWLQTASLTPWFLARVCNVLTVTPTHSYSFILLSMTCAPALDFEPSYEQLKSPPLLLYPRTCWPAIVADAIFQTDPSWCTPAEACSEDRESRRSWGWLMADWIRIHSGGTLIVAPKTKRSASSATSKSITWRQAKLFAITRSLIKYTCKSPSVSLLRSLLWKSCNLQSEIPMGKQQCSYDPSIVGQY